MKRFLPLIIAVCACLLPLFFPSCANTTQAPSGGKKDTIPPYIIDIKPCRAMCQSCLAIAKRNRSARD